MVNAIQQQLNDLRHRLRTGPVGKFFAWWVGELRSALPVAWQEKLQHATRRLVVTLSTHTHTHTHTHTPS